MVQNKLSMPRIYDRMESENLDVLLALTPENVFYLSDLPVSPVSPNRLLNVVKNSSPSFCIIPREGEAKLVVTNAGIEVAEKNSWVKDIRTYATGTYIVRPERSSREIIAADPVDALAKVLVTLGKNLRVGADEKTAASGILGRLKTAAKGVRFVDATTIFENLRMIKSPEEVRRFREANKILCAAIEKLIDEAGVGVSEEELLRVLKSTILKEGGDSWQQTTVAIGPDNGPDIYNQPTQRKMKRGEITRVDVGCVYRGYTADLSRTLVAGQAAQEATRLYRVLQEAELDLLDSCKPGVKASEMHALVVKYVRKHFDKKYFRGNVGHGCGVELYDMPVISKDDYTEMQEGMTLSLEVPYHKFGLGGFNIEDSVVVTKRGAEIVSDLPRELIMV